MNRNYWYIFSSLCNYLSAECLIWKKMKSEVFWFLWRIFFSFNTVWKVNIFNDISPSFLLAKIVLITLVFLVISIVFVHYLFSIVFGFVTSLGIQSGWREYLSINNNWIKSLDTLLHSQASNTMVIAWKE